LVVDLVRGKSVEEALNILHFHKKHASIYVAKVIKSAVANIIVKEDKQIDPKDIVVKEIFVNGGTMLKRILPAPMGRAYRIRKRSCSITVKVATKS
jgi:large subunit ribosomal protein L22